MPDIIMDVSRWQGRITEERRLRMAINAFNIVRDGSTALALHFRVRELRCRN